MDNAQNSKLFETEVKRKNSQNLYIRQCMLREAEIKAECACVCWCIFALFIKAIKLQAAASVVVIVTII